MDKTITGPLALVLLAYNAGHFLRQALFSLMAQFDASWWSRVEIRQRLKSFHLKLGQARWPLQLVIVDNNSKDDSLKIAYEFQRKAAKIKFLSIKIIANKENLGFCRGNNVGLRWAARRGFRYLALLNNDTVVGNAFWEKMVTFMERTPAAGIATTKIYFAPGYEYHRHYREVQQGRVIWAAGGMVDWRNVIGSNRGVDEVDQGQYEKAALVDNASGCFLLAPTRLWHKVHYLDEKYFMYYEDADLAEKVKRLKKRIYYVPGGLIWHFNAGSSKVGGDLQDYFITRNRLLFGMRWAPWRAKQALLRESIRLLWRGRHWQRVAVKDFYLGKFGRGSWR